MWTWPKMNSLRMRSSRDSLGRCPQELVHVSPAPAREKSAFHSGKARAMDLRGCSHQQGTPQAQATRVNSRHLSMRTVPKSVFSSSGSCPRGLSQDRSAGRRKGVKVVQGGSTESERKRLVCSIQIPHSTRRRPPTSKWGDSERSKGGATTAPLRSNKCSTLPAPPQKEAKSKRCAMVGAGG